MSADREPTAVEVIAAHQRQGASACLCGPLRLGSSFPEHQLAALEAAGFVVATRDEIRAWPVEQQAELIDAEAQGGYHWGDRFYPSGAGDEIDSVRVVGPWREVQP